MGVKRYELSEAQWVRIAPLLPGKVGDPGRSGTDNRLFVNGVLWVLRSGAFWQHLAGALWQVEERPCPLHPLGQSRRVGEGVRRTDQGSRQQVPDARHHLGSGPPAGGRRKRGPKLRR